ncbi:MAG TPA: hypothetical protein VH299_03285 [Solirubrobacterales bacterium]|nr:hypothetical protein [Solirubrobacterales bacterium]
MSRRVSETPTARRQADALRGKVADAYYEAVQRLMAEGCAAADYRLTGDVVDRICALHLYGRYRALVCFPEKDRLAVVLIAEHDRGGDGDVYAALYEFLEIPEPIERRTKPPCCDEDGEPPVDSELLDRLLIAAKELRRRG